MSRIVFIVLSLASALVCAEISHVVTVASPVGSPLPKLLCPFVYSLAASGNAELESFARNVALSKNREDTLVALDYLEEHHSGDRAVVERVKFARAQIALSQLLEKHAATEIDHLPVKLREEARSLDKIVKNHLADHGRDWVPNLPFVISYSFRDGILHGATLDTAQLEAAIRRDPTYVGTFFRDLKQYGIERIAFSGERMPFWSELENAGLDGIKEIHIPRLFDYVDDLGFLRAPALRKVEQVDWLPSGALDRTAHWLLNGGVGYSPNLKWVGPVGTLRLQQDIAEEMANSESNSVRTLLADYCRLYFNSPQSLSQLRTVHENPALTRSILRVLLPQGKIRAYLGEHRTLARELMEYLKNEPALLRDLQQILSDYGSAPI